MMNSVLTFRYVKQPMRKDVHYSCKVYVTQMNNTSPENLD